MAASAVDSPVGLIKRALARAFSRTEKVFEYAFGQRNNPFVSLGALGWSLLSGNRASREPPMEGHLQENGGHQRRDEQQCCQPETHRRHIVLSRCQEPDRGHHFRPHQWSDDPADPTLVVFGCERVAVPGEDRVLHQLHHPQHARHGPRGGRSHHQRRHDELKRRNDPMSTATPGEYNT